MAGGRFGRSPKRGPLGFAAKVSLAVVLGLSFIVIWSTFSPTSSAEVSSKRSSFGDISEPDAEIATAAARKKEKERKKKQSSPLKDGSGIRNGSAVASGKRDKEVEREEGGAEDKGGEKKAGEIEEVVPKEDGSNRPDGKQEEEEKKVGEEKAEVEGADEIKDGEDGDLEDGVDVNLEGDEEGGDGSKKRNIKKKKKLGPLFDPAVRYHWRQCGARSGHNYIPCVDMEGDGSQRHHERSCPRSAVICLVSLPTEYKPAEPWPERESKVWYSNIGHPRLSAYVKAHAWMNLSEEYLLFPLKNSEFKGGAHHYVDAIEEMVPDIDWGKNIRMVLDIGCVNAGFGAAMLEKNVMALSLGTMNDLTNLAQVALERGIPAVVGNLGTKRLPFPSGVFDAIHCGGCNLPWHSNGGRLLLEMNRILRPGGYFIISTKQSDVDGEQGISTLMAAICWNVLAHKTDDDGEMGIKIYQRPASNDIYELRRSKEPIFCKENENQDTAWYTPIRTCLHKVPAAIEERGSAWPEEWPKRLEAFPDWLGDLQEKLVADHNHWKAIIERSYLVGMGIDWSNIRNVMDMKAIYGGFAAALASRKVWVMNVVPVHAPNTLPIIYERGLLGIYHDWCEPFSTFPRSYDLLHADHLFSRLKNRCKQSVAILVEMDRILRPGGWAIIRDKVEILNPVEMILKSLHWEIRMTYGKDKESIICAQKSTWRP